MLRLWNMLIGTFLFAALPAIAGCGEVFINLTASLGGDTAGQRGAVRILFINNTPARPVFTFGTYDPLDQFSEPDFDQFGLDDSSRILDGMDTSEVLSMECARVFGIGAPQLLTLIRENLPDVTPDEAALVEGVKFHEIGPDGQAGQELGAAPAFEARLGVDFPCGALLIFRLESDDLGPDPYRVDFELISTESTR